jgi:hypothetical protein
MFEGRFGVSQTGSEDGLADFSSNKSAPANRMGGFYTSRLPKNEEIRGISV